VAVQESQDADPAKQEKAGISKVGKGRWLKATGRKERKRGVLTSQPWLFFYKGNGECIPSFISASSAPVTNKETAKKLSLIY
jgi:hypothetical protein